MKELVWQRRGQAKASSDQLPETEYEREIAAYRWCSATF
jgi:hypothetical protein